MTWNSVMGFVSSVALFLPIFLILVLRLGGYRSFPFLLVYYAMVLIYNLFKEGYIHANQDVVYYWGISNNLLDTPLMLFFLTYFSTSALFTRRLIVLILSFIVFELAVVLLLGFNIKILTIILGPGLLIVFALSLYSFVRQSKIVITNRKSLGKTLIAASQVIAYGCYGILYMLFYVFKTRYVADSFLVYFFVTTFSSLVLCAGIVFEKSRIKKLFELKQSRKELQGIYKDSKAASSFSPVLPDFDREAWN